MFWVGLVTPWPPVNTQTSWARRRSWRRRIAPSCRGRSPSAPGERSSTRRPLASPRSHQPSPGYRWYWTSASLRGQGSHTSIGVKGQSCVTWPSPQTQSDGHQLLLVYLCLLGLRCCVPMRRLVTNKAAFDENRRQSEEIVFHIQLWDCCDFVEQRKQQADANVLMPEPVTMG